MLQVAELELAQTPDVAERVRLLEELARIWEQELDDPQQAALHREQAAALLQSVVGNHALVDGNKRLGWLATAVFLDLNGVPIHRAANDDVYRLVMDVAATSPELDEIERRLRRLLD